MSDDGHYSRRSGPRDRQLRVGDAEREAVADILRREHLAGRLDNDEFDERVARCLAAKTYAELDELIGDFPADEREARRRERGVAVLASAVRAPAASGRGDRLQPRARRLACGAVPCLVRRPAVLLARLRLARSRPAQLQPALPAIRARPSNGSGCGEKRQAGSFLAQR